MCRSGLITWNLTSFNIVSDWLSPGIKEVFVEQNALSVLNAAYTLWDDITLRINEFMAVNTSHTGITDEHGDADDWIEIYNTTDSPIDMGGMYIADEQDIWRIPIGYPGQTTVGAKGYLLLWADDEEETEGPLHLAFELDADGDEITLYDTDGTTVIDSIVFDNQMASVSYGRYPDASNSFYYFTDPTEGKYNDQAGIANKVADTEFTPDRGFHTSPFYVTITTETPGATIYYTTDSTWPIDENGNPTATAQEYNGTTNKPYITTTTNLRAAAVKTGNLPTNTDTQTYIFLDDVLQQPTNPAGYPSQWISGGSVITGDYQVDPDIVNHTNAENQLTTDDMHAVPTIVVSMPINDWFQSGHGLYVTQALDGTEYVCSFEYIDPKDNGLVLQQNCAMSMQGGISGGGTSLNRWKTPKLSNRPRFKTQTDDGTLTGGPPKLRARIFPDSPVTSFDTLVLDAVLNHSWHHSSSSQRNTVKYLQDQGVGDYHNAMLPGHSPHGSYVHMYINTLYWGMYYLHERPDHSWAAETFGGEKEEYDAIKHNSGNVINNGIGGSGASSNFSTMENAASAAESDPSNLTKWQTVEQHLDVDNLITYLLAHWFAGLHDWPGKNWYATHRVGGQWRFHTWDAEHSFESYNNTGQCPEGVHARLDSHPEYKMRWADHIHKHFHHDGPLDDYPRCFEFYKARVAQVNEAIRGESARWGDYRRSSPHNRLEWLGVNTQDGSYFTNRSSNVFGYLSGLYPDTDPPDFEINGSPMYGGYASSGDILTITNPNGSGTIYYTLNGNDPRAFGGAVNTAGGAVAYGSVIPLNHSIRVKARVLRSGEWSALSDAVFAVGPLAQDLRITEIMYHPEDTNNPIDPNTEFIELKNIGASTLNLNLVKFTEGIHFTFPDIELDPDENIVVVEDESAFEAKYGTGVYTAGSYTGSLANNGERIKLEDATGQTILDFEYKDGWYSITDGEGFSLTIIDPTYSASYGSDEGLIAYWNFDDGSGVTVVDSAGTNNGTLYGDPTWVNGRINGALSFDGVDDYVAVAPIDPLIGDTLTAQAWIRTSEFAGIWNPIMTQNTGGNGYYFYVSSGRPAFYVVVGASFVEAVSPEAINANQWYHIAGTNDGSNLKLYVDSQLKSSASSTGFLGINNNAYIGCEPTSQLYFNGLIDEVCIYNRPLSESEFQIIENPTARWGLKSSWRASVYRNGSPGWDDSGILPNPGAVVINELMSHSNAGPDWIELYNTTDEPINIGGWFLSDNDKSEPNLMKYRIADGTIIDANDYLVFYQDTDFNNPGDPGCLVPFALSENGEKACLSSGLDPNGYLTGYRDVENFGASQTNVSFGRYYKVSTDNYNFVAMDYNTPDANNAYPKVGPVVINEIMYNPPSGNQEEEYIELHNITGVLVTLYRYDKSTPWKFTDGIDYTFSASPVVTIPAYGYLMVVKDVTAFTTRYGGMPPGVQVLDGYTGRLSNSGERLQIGMPGDIDEALKRYYIRIDRVTYSDGLHPEDCPGNVDLWPREADGAGKSLSRKVSTDYGNDVANWEAATPSPGVANP
ncbi:MAG: lamin tail domain-containing protein [Planctomycetota bacterium]